MNRKQRTVIEELEYFQTEIAQGINTAIIEYNEQQKSRIRRRFIKPIDKSEILSYLLKKFGKEVVFNHLTMLSERKQEERKNFIDKYESQKKPTQIVNGYSTRLATPQVKGESNDGTAAMEMIFERQYERKYLNDNPFYQVIGDPSVIANEIANEFDTDWLKTPWHGGDVKYRVKRRLEVYSKINRLAYPLLTFLNVSGGLISIFIAVIILGSWASAAGEYNFDTWEFFHSPMVGEPRYAWLFTGYSFVLAVTARYYTSKTFNLNIDNPLRIVALTDIIRRIYLIEYNLLLILYTLGSIILEYYFVDPVLVWLPSNGIYFNNLYDILIIPSVAFYFFVSYYKKTVHGEGFVFHIRWFFDRSKTRIITYFILIFIYFNMMMSSVSYLISNITYGEDFYNLNNSGHDMLYTLNSAFLIFHLLILMNIRRRVNEIGDFPWANAIHKVTLYNFGISVVVTILNLIGKMKYASNYHSDYQVNYASLLFDFILFSSLFYFTYKYMKRGISHVLEIGLRESGKQIMQLIITYLESRTK